MMTVCVAVTDKEMGETILARTSESVVDGRHLNKRLCRPYVTSCLLAKRFSIHSCGVYKEAGKRLRGVRHFVGEGQHIALALNMSL